MALVNGISTKEAARKLGYSEDRLTELVREGKIVPGKVVQWHGYVWDENISKDDLLTRRYNRGQHGG